MNRKEFVNLNRLGKRYRTTHFTVILKENGLNISRIGITVRKKIGNAVKRNRVKRLIREIFRLNKRTVPRGYDIVVIANSGADSLDFWKIRDELGEIILDQTSVS